MAHLASSERTGLVATFEKFGPNVRTLCEGWQTKELLAHLVLRERNPGAALGILFTPLADRTERLTREIAPQFAKNLELFRMGPPRWSPMRYGDALVNSSEMLIHHEDVLRAQPGWKPRSLSSEQEHEVRRLLRGAAQFMARGASVKVRPDPAGSLTPKEGEVVLRGDAVDILLRIAGRRESVSVEVLGSPRDVALFESSRLGI